MRAEILDLPAQHYFAYNQAQNELEGLFFMLVNEDRSLKITPVDEIREINDFCYYEYHADRHDAYYELVQEEFYKLFVRITKMRTRRLNKSCVRELAKRLMKHRLQSWTN